MLGKLGMIIIIIVYSPSNTASHSWMVALTGGGHYYYCVSGQSHAAQRYTAAVRVVSVGSVGVGGFLVTVCCWDCTVCW